MTYLAKVVYGHDLFTTVVRLKPIRVNKDGNLWARVQGGHKKMLQNDDDGPVNSYRSVRTELG